jgi:myo-inositol-1(or 4)-monophosphatase
VRLQPRDKSLDPGSAGACAVVAAREAGALLRRNLRSVKRVNEATRHDLKLELDVRCQRLIERRLRSGFPGVALLGEEGTTGSEEAAWRWVVDPIDGTVNYAHGIPHACVSIALQARQVDADGPAVKRDVYRTIVGVVYDPFLDELWEAVAGGAARLNGRRIRVSQRRRLGEAIMTLGFAKHASSLRRMLPVFGRLVHRVRKLRIMGSAALGLTYVATGRFDGYVESGLRLWDIAAGALLVECAGGRCDCVRLRGRHRFSLAASNGWLHGALAPLARESRSTS